MLKFVILCAAFLTSHAFADEKTCTVDGPHCKGCMEMIEGKVCDDKVYSKCEVKILDEDKKIGQIYVVTKDAAAKVDEKVLAKQLTDLESDYSLKKCSAGKPKEPKAAKKS